MISSDKKFDNNVILSEALALALIKGKYKVTPEKFADSTGRVIHIDVDDICKESLILVSSRVFYSLGKEKEKINPTFRSTFRNKFSGKCFPCNQ
ncbi:MAG: hypothetical protein ACJAXJ_004047 [Colwellia sp.]|jgi:hypothetical protein